MGRLNEQGLQRLVTNIKEEVSTSVDGVNASVDLVSSEIDTIKNELKVSENTKYATTNGVKEFECKSGYVDNVKIEGKTLVNLAKINSIDGSNQDGYVRTRFQPGNSKDYNLNSLTSNDIFTIFNFADKPFIVRGVDSNSNYLSSSDVFVDGNSFKVTDHLNSALVGIDFRPQEGWSNSDLSIYKSDMFAILKGDHTNKPISYFEGLKSVGQGDKIEVLSINENLITNVGINALTESNGNLWNNDGSYSVDDSEYIYIPKNTWDDFGGLIRTEQDTSYNFSCNLKELNGAECKLVVAYFSSKPTYNVPNSNINNYMGVLKTDAITTHGVHNLSFTTPHNCNYALCVVSFKTQDMPYVMSDFMVTKYNIKANYIQPKYDKKQILTTLRSLPNGVKDEIIKQGDKYYKLKRCEEVVLDGNNNGFALVTSSSPNTISCSLIFNDAKGDGSGSTVISNIFVDKIKPTHPSDRGADKELITIANFANEKQLFLRIAKSKLVTQDLEGFKAYLKANPVTVVYELATQQLIELPNFNPRTFDNKTTLLLNSGVVQGDAEFEVTNSMGSSLDVMASKVSDVDEGLLSNKYNYQSYKLTNDIGKPKKRIDGTDLNALLETGYYYGANIINAPNNATHYIEVFRGDVDGYYSQKCWTVNTHTPILYIRNHTATLGWGSWQKVTTSSTFDLLEEQVQAQESKIDVINRSNKLLQQVSNEQANKISILEQENANLKLCVQSLLMGDIEKARNLLI